MGNRDDVRSFGCALILLVYFVAAMALIFLFCGCARTVYVPTETHIYHTDTLRQYNAQVDSVYLRDSILILERGDTVYVTSYRDRYRYVGRSDTIYKSVRDTARIEVPFPVEKPLSGWQQFKMDFGGLAIGGLFAMVIAAIVLLVRRFNIK